MSEIVSPFKDIAQLNHPSNPSSATNFSINQVAANIWMNQTSSPILLLPYPPVKFKSSKTLLNPSLSTTVSAKL